MPTTRERVRLGHFGSSLTWQTWLRNIRSTVAKTHATCKLHDSIFYRTGVIADRSCKLQEWGFSACFCSCDLDLDSMTFIYELDQYSLEIYRMWKYELFTSRLSKVIVWHTDRQTDKTEIIYHAALRVVKDENKREEVTVHYAIFC